MNDLKKTIRHLFYTTSNFVHHFKSIGEFKLLHISWGPMSKPIHYFKWEYYNVLILYTVAI